MAADLKRCQALAEPLGWEVNYAGAFCGRTRYSYRMKDSDGAYGFEFSLAPIRERLAKEYRELANRSYADYGIAKVIASKDSQVQPYIGRLFENIADELSVGEEPTIVERLKEERDRPLDLCSYEQLFLDALIQFGERLDAIERGKE